MTPQNELSDVYLPGNSSGKNPMKAELDHPVKVTLQFGKTQVKIVVSPTNDMADPHGASLVDVMMEGARKKAHEAARDNSPHLPQKCSPEDKKNYNQKDDLYSAVIELLENKHKSFPNAKVACNEGKAILGVLTDVLRHSPREVEHKS